MVQINFAQKQVNAKVVYYGPGMSGKTTNLEVVHQRAPSPNRGDLTSISTDGDRTLFFDFMPLDLGTVAGMRTCFQIYTVPGQVYYNSTRKLVLQGVDGVVFVADSSASMVQENLESLKNLEQNLNEYGKSLATLPHIIQFNKRDLPDAMSVEELQKLLNAHNAPCFEAVANTGQGVFPTLKALAARVLETIHTGTRGTPAPAQPVAAAPAPQPTGHTSFTQRQAQPQRPAAGAGAPISMAPQPRSPMPSPAQPAPPQHAPMPVAADATSRTAFHAPPTGGPAPTAPRVTHGHGVPAGHGAQPGHGTPAAPTGYTRQTGMATPPPQATAGSLQMMRPQESMAPAPPLSSTGYNRSQPAAAATGYHRPQPAAPARPVTRPTAPRPAAQRPAASRPRAQRAPAGVTTVGSGKKNLSTTLLIVAALVAGAIMAFAVLT
jgi:signal recognition particle receptor subunit beta